MSESIRLASVRAPLLPTRLAGIGQGEQDHPPHKKAHSLGGLWAGRQLLLQWWPRNGLGFKFQISAGIPAKKRGPPAKFGTRQSGSVGGVSIRTHTLERTHLLYYGYYVQQYHGKYACRALSAH